MNWCKGSANNFGESVMLKMLFTVAAIAVATSSTAEPDATTRYLINEPASLLDVGILRVADRLGPDWKVVYNPQDDTIDLITSVRDVIGDKFDAERKCKWMIEFTRLSAGIGGIALFTVSPYATDFLHASVKVNTEFDIRAERGEEFKRLVEIDRKFHLIVAVYYGASGQPQRKIVCSAPLLGESYTLDQ